ncbi:hypothetical protein HDU92_000130 [Lobulomyces angularis]|nr:hypothetical protein HDU92_000130 [Lobulomyces angularis]
MSQTEKLLPGWIPFNQNSENASNSQLNIDQKFDKIYNCDRCQKSFTRYVNLPWIFLHFFIHLNPSNLSSITVTLTHYVIHNLNSHRITHTQERKFQCNSCELKFSRAYDLRRHEKTHEKVKTYQCQYCKRFFSRGDALKRHLSSRIYVNGSDSVLSCINQIKIEKKKKKVALNNVIDENLIAKNNESMDNQKFTSTQNDNVEPSDNDNVDDLVNFDHDEEEGNQLNIFQSNSLLTTEIIGFENESNLLSEDEVDEDAAQVFEAQGQLQRSLPDNQNQCQQESHQQQLHHHQQQQHQHQQQQQQQQQQHSNEFHNGVQHDLHSISSVLSQQIPTATVINVQELMKHNDYLEMRVQALDQTVSTLNSRVNELEVEKKLLKSLLFEQRRYNTSPSNKEID